MLGSDRSALRRKLSTVWRRVIEPVTFCRSTTFQTAERCFCGARRAALQDHAVAAALHERLRSPLDLDRGAVDGAAQARVQRRGAPAVVVFSAPLYDTIYIE